MNSKYLVPFKAGSLMHYAEDRERGIYKPDEWREPEEFEAILTMDRSVSGMSAKYFIWTDEEGHTFPMFASDLVHLVQSGTIHHGKAFAVWKPGKRGSNFGIKFVREA